MNKKTSRDKTVEARRKLIVETAAHCFIEQGFHQTSIRDIANQANISLGNLYNHFESKSALIAEIATLEAQDIDIIERQVLKITNPAKAIDKFINLYIQYCSRHENIMLTAEIVSEGLRNSEIGMGFLENKMRLHSLVEQLVTANSLDKNQLEPKFASDFIIDLIEGLATRKAFEEKKPSKAEIAALKTSIARILNSKILFGKSKPAS